MLVVLRFGVKNDQRPQVTRGDLRVPLFPEFKLIAGQTTAVVVEVAEKDNVSWVVGQLVVIIAAVQDFLIHQLLIFPHPEGQIVFIHHLHFNGVGPILVIPRIDINSNPLGRRCRLDRVLGVSVLDPLNR